MPEQNEQKLVTLKINDRDVQVPPGTLVIEATRRIRTREKGTRHFIVAMTANAMSGDRELCIDAGLEVVRAALRRRRVFLLQSRGAPSFPR